jgi:hypothetical protein
VYVFGSGALGDIPSDCDREKALAQAFHKFNDEILAIIFDLILGGGASKKAKSEGGR